VEAWTERQPGRPAKRPAIHGNCGANPAGDQNVWIQCYRLAEQQKNVRAMIEILRYLTDRRDGKAYVAENPAERQKADSLPQDNHMQAAIRELVLPGLQKASPDTNSTDPGKAEWENILN
jgi:hypothetical protein